MKLALAFLIASIAAWAGTLTPSCNPCAAGQVITLTGTGFKLGYKDTVLVVVVWGSPVPVECSVPDKAGAFTCVTAIPLAGTFTVDAYEQIPYSDRRGKMTQFASATVQVE